MTMCFHIFKKSEYKNGDEATRGKKGPLYVSDIVEKHPLCEEFIRGSSELGIQVQNDYNSGQQEGIFTINVPAKNGTRFSAYDAFLKPALKKENVNIKKNTTVLKIIFKNKKAVGILCKKNNKTIEIFANKEIILCAGAIGTPHLLQVSGIGEAKHLKSIGIEPLFEIKNVGEGVARPLCCWGSLTE